MPHGVIAMSPDVPGPAQNSTNLAVVTTNAGMLRTVYGDHDASANRFLNYEVSTSPETAHGATKTVTTG